jgi:AraC-like DNA-binding protein
VDNTAIHFERLRFAASDWPEALRVDIWRRELGCRLFAASIDRLGERPFEASTRLRVLPGLIFGSGLVGPSAYRRGRGIVAHDNDDFFFFINETGASTVAQKGREITLRAGQATMISCAEPGALLRQRRGRASLVRVPRKSLLPLVPQAEDALARPLACDRTILNLIGLYTASLYDPQPGETPELHQLAQSHIRDLVALAAGASPANARDGFAAARLYAVKQSIAQNADRHDLRASEIAALHGLSERSMQRLFERSGESFSRYLLEQRLQRAWRMLGNRLGAPPSISDVAYDCGFGDLSHFNRVFRRRFGMAPSEVRGKSH